MKWLWMFLLPISGFAQVVEVTHLETVTKASYRLVNPRLEGLLIISHSAEELSENRAEESFERGRRGKANAICRRLGQVLSLDPESVKVRNESPASGEEQYLVINAAEQTREISRPAASQGYRDEFHPIPYTGGWLAYRPPTRHATSTTFQVFEKIDCVPRT